MNKNILRFWIQILVIAITLPLTSQINAHACTSLTMAGPPDFPPVVWSDYKETHGAAKDLLQQVLQKQGIQLTTDHVGGYRRVLKAFQDGRIQVVAGIPRTPETQAIGQFTSSPLYTHSLTVLVRRSTPEKPKSWSDLLELKGAMPDQLSIEEIFSEDQLPKKMIRTFTPNLALKMLRVGRVDYTIYPNIQDDLMVSLLNLEGTLEKLPFISHKVPVYVALSNNIDCEISVEKLNRDIQNFIRSGEADQTLNDSLYKWMSYQLKKRDSL